jgi:hypothetical protein
MPQRRCTSDRAEISAERNLNSAAKTTGSHLPTAVSTASTTNTTGSSSSASGSTPMNSSRKPPTSSVTPPHLRRRATEGLLDSSPNATVNGAQQVYCCTHVLFMYRQKYTRAQLAMSSDWC